MGEQILISGRWMGRRALTDQDRRIEEDSIWKSTPRELRVGMGGGLVSRNARARDGGFGGRDEVFSN